MAVSNQVKVPEDTKREVALYSAATGISQGELLALSWREFKARRPSEFQEKLRWAREILAGSEGEAALHASGMSPEDLESLRQATNR